ncbi:transcriptional regulator with XRE-family HTH domain [Mucilaginibacter sp. SG538B]|uniref:helix-turn-helix transcriptional regulator n=1 Tax=Mucilaginibacter sp. SG538B TaxID=2587021 RepID=UPI0017F6CFFC|nr:helix-turn-helix transcriptional regulator [Mucilaginibacter sp. SG538B]NVM65064.1 transcriptional regulator with XRE-family HTH domain [Mucilaginibacter sp. SG538B]
MNTDSSKNIHQGRNVKRFREMLGLKQEALAYALGEDWSQKRVSLLEQKEVIEDDILNQVAAILKVPVDAIKNLDENGAINIIANTYTNNDNSSTLQGHYINYNPNFNPIEKIVSLYDEKVALLERLLESEREKVEMLRKGNG